MNVVWRNCFPSQLHVKVRAQSRVGLVLRQRYQVAAPISRFPGRYQCFGTASNQNDMSSREKAKKLYEEGRVMVEENEMQRIRGIRKLRGAAMKNYVPAQTLLGGALLQEAKREDQREFFRKVFPSVDRFGKPAGGATTAKETLAQIIKERMKFRKKQQSKENEYTTREEGLIWLQKAVRAGDIKAGLELANVFLKEEEEFEILSKTGMTFNDAMSLVNKGIESKCPESMLFAVRLESTTDKLIKDEMSAESLRMCRFASASMLQEAAQELNYPDAYLWLAYLHMGMVDDANLDLPRDTNLSFSFLVTAAEMGNAEAQYLASRVFAETEEYTKEAREFLDMAVAQEYGHALTHCGNLFMEDEPSFYTNGVDQTRALRYYERAAMKEDVNGLLNAGMMLVDGQGAKPNVVEGFRYFAKAAELGSLTALEYIAYFMTKGLPPFQKPDEKRGQELIDLLQAVYKEESESEEDHMPLEDEMEMLVKGYSESLFMGDLETDNTLPIKERPSALPRQKRPKLLSNTSPRK